MVMGEARENISAFLQPRLRSDTVLGTQNSHFKVGQYKEMWSFLPQQSHADINTKQVAHLG